MTVHQTQGWTSGLSNAAAADVTFEVKEFPTAEADEFPRDAPVAPPTFQSVNGAPEIAVTTATLKPAPIVASVEWRVERAFSLTMRLCRAPC